MLAAVLGVVVLLLAGIGVLWAITPSAGDAEASLLAQAPSAYDPYTHLDLAKQRQRHVLDQLVATGSLSASHAGAAFAAPLGLTTQ